MKLIKLRVAPHFLLRCLSLPAMVKHVVFDFDGTIADSEEVCFRLLNELARVHGYPQISRERFVGLKQLTYPERLQALGVPMVRLPMLSIEARRVYRFLQDDLKPYEGVVEMVRDLKQRGFRLHVLSSNAVANIRAFLVRHDLDVFETVNCERSFFGKHVGLRRFLEANNLSSSEAVYVADELRDVEACRKVGLRVISVAWGFDLEERLSRANPGMIALGPGSLPEMIQALPSAARPAESLNLLQTAVVGLAS